MIKLEQGRFPQAGFTLIEIMISMILGILIIGAVGSVYLGSKQTYRSRDALSLLQENGRIALFQIRQGALPAGFPAIAEIDPVIYNAALQLEDGSFPSSEDGTVPAGGNTVEFPSEGDASDTVTLGFLPQGAYTRDCLGSTKTINGRIVNSFYVKKKSTLDNPQRRQLMCRGAGGAQPVADAVDSLQVRYGVDTSGNGFPDQYMNATQVGVTLQWSSVVSLRVAVLANSLQVFKQNFGTESETFDLLGTQLSVKPDGRLRRVFTTTIPFRNKTPML